ncbi:MAG: ABC transporter ATP-binding protein [Deltaproteobacteria bacterium]|nr:ABC transporter ATP-binding protein [Deltaproteobacteria bacterium]
MNTSKVPLNNSKHHNIGLGRNFSLLDVDRASKRFGGIQALNDVTFSIEQGSIISMIGPNGAGKTTFINVVTGIYAPEIGQVCFQGQDITGLTAHAIAYLGIGRTFQLEELFPSLTVLENAMVGCHTRSRCGMFSSGLRLLSAKTEEQRIREEAMENLKMIGLEHKASDSVSSLPLGERKLIGIARALGIQPKLLMLDEPVGGLAAHEIEKLVKVIDILVNKGLTLFIVEHNMPFVMSVSERVIVLDGGRKIVEGPPDEVKTNEQVIKAYLGEEV